MKLLLSHKNINIAIQLVVCVLNSIYDVNDQLQDNKEFLKQVGDCISFVMSNEYLHLGLNLFQGMKEFLPYEIVTEIFKKLLLEDTRLNYFINFIQDFKENTEINPDNL